ncbi:MAG: geranylgeranylglyceryl/heptaprenylglyceryl phosphate synthase [Candidatus Lokiarchaeota archaeon]|nr:geranylgeranylglyceryl/heptaprenylglyceryl phosphate synthase [Candidatus Lokiarchaeota archaeon]
MNEIYNKIVQQLQQEGVLHVSLIDPDPIKQTIEDAGKMAKIAAAAGTDIIFIGGSTCFDRAYIDNTILDIKKQCNLPVILFPGSISGISAKADAALFMSLLNSTNHYYISGQQALASFTMKSFDMEPIGTAYLIVEPGSGAGWLGDVKLLPRSKPEISLGYALAAEYFGFKMVYLEAGSGSEATVPESIIRLIKKSLTIPIIVGGGIRTKADAVAIVNAGADLIVQGTILEEMLLKDHGKSLSETIAAIKLAGKKKLESSS